MSIDVSEMSKMISLYRMSTVGSSNIFNSESTTGSSNNSVLFEYMLKSALEGSTKCSGCQSSKSESNDMLSTVSAMLLSSMGQGSSPYGSNSSLYSSLLNQRDSNTSLAVQNALATYNNNSKINETSTPSTTTSTNKTQNTSSSEVYGVYGDFYPMGKAPTLKSKDINISPRIESAIKSASEKYGVEESFVKAMIKQESSFNPNTKSSAGAMGLMQLMSYNCKDYGVKDPYNIEQNVNGGVKYIKDLLDKFNGNKQLALAAYNGGITRMRNRGVDTVPEIVKMPKETRDYVSKVMGYYNQYSKIQQA